MSPKQGKKFKKPYKKQGYKKKAYKKYYAPTQGYMNRDFKYTATICLMIDNNYNIDYGIGVSRGSSGAGGSNAVWMPAGSTGYFNSGAPFTLSNALSDFSSPVILPYYYLLGSALTTGALGLEITNYKYYKLNSTTLKINETVSKNLGVGYSAPATAVPIPHILNVIANYPTLYFNVKENVGLGWGANNTPTVFNLMDDSFSTWSQALGEPQRDDSSLRFNPNATNDKYSLQRTFKHHKIGAGNAIFNATSFNCYTIDYPAWWNCIKQFSSSDPAPGFTNYINGGIIMGSLPRYQLSTQFQNTNYQNQFVNFAELEITINFSFCGKTGYTTSVTP